MNDNTNLPVSSRWPSYKKIWWLVAIILFIVLIILWLMGYAPGGKHCSSHTNISKETIVDNSTYISKISALEKENMQIVVLKEELQQLRLEANNSSSTDSFAPVITLNDAAVIQQLERGSQYVEAGASAVDNVDGSLQVKVSGLVDSSTAGNYQIVYTAVDSSGNSSEAVRTIIVAATSDTEANIYFGIGSAEVPSGIESLLSGVLSHLKSHPGSIAKISGFHDVSGSLDFNTDLAKRRSQAVYSILLQNGISAEQLVFEKPAQTAGTGTPKEARRVEVKVISDN